MCHPEAIQSRRQPCRLVAVDHVLCRVPGTEQVGRNVARLRRAMPNHRHERNHTAAARDEGQWSSLLDGPGKIAAEWPPKVQAMSRRV